MNPITFRFVILKEHIHENGDWLVAQCLENDMALQVRSMGELPQSICATIVTTFRLAAGHGINLLEEGNWTRAPKEFWGLFERNKGDGPVLYFNFKIPASEDVQHRAELAFVG